MDAPTRIYLFPLTSQEGRRHASLKRSLSLKGHSSNEAKRSPRLLSTQITDLIRSSARRTGRWCSA